MSPYEDPEPLRTEAEHLRELLREVANCPLQERSVALPGRSGGWIELTVSADLWAKLVPLRTPSIVKVDGNG